MVKLHRGDVIEVKYHYDPKTNKFKTRPVIVLHNAPKNADVVSVYCTSQNDGNDEDSIFVPFDSKEGILIGLTKDTYIRPGIIKTIEADFINRPLGKCPFMNDILKLIEKKMSR